LKTDRDPLTARSRFGARVLGVSASYLDVLGIRRRRGRGSRPDDFTSQNGVAIATEGVAAALWPNQDPIGQRLLWRPLNWKRTGWEPPAEVVGVVQDFDRASPDGVLVRTVLAPLDQNYAPRGIVVVRGNSDGRLLAGRAQHGLEWPSPRSGCSVIRSVRPPAGGAFGPARPRCGRRLRPPHRAGRSGLRPVRA
jgi:hypothetical protein